MPLKTAVQRRACQRWESGLQRVEAVIERQQRVAPEGDDDGLVLRREHGRARVLGPGALVGNRGPRSPLSDRLRVDPVAPGQNPQALLTMLYRSTHRLCRAGAPVENLAHSASFHSRDKNALSNPGTKHLMILFAGLAAALPVAAAPVLAVTSGGTTRQFTADELLAWPTAATI